MDQCSVVNRTVQSILIDDDSNCEDYNANTTIILTLILINIQ